MIQACAVTPLLALTVGMGGLTLVNGTAAAAYGGAEPFDTTQVTAADELTVSRSGERGDTDADDATGDTGTDMDGDATASDGSDGQSQSVTTPDDTTDDDTTDGADTDSVTADGEWSVGDSTSIDDSDSLTLIQADNETVQTLINTRDEDDLPDDFDPNHDDGDTGNAYSFSQCTWWVYVRRHQLNLPVGSYMGNGAQWADSARELGYWVDSTPRVGDVMVFDYGQDGASALYGHVAVVEDVLDDGSVVTSECGVAYNGEPFTRTFSAEDAAEHEYIHY